MASLDPPWHSKPGVVYETPLQDPYTRQNMGVVHETSEFTVDPLMTSESHMANCVYFCFC